MLAPPPLFCRYQEFVEYADWDPRWATGEQIGDLKRMGESMTPDLRSTRWLQWKHAVVDNSVQTFTKSYKKKKDFRQTASRMVRTTVTSVVRAGAECDAVPKGAIPFHAFAH